MVLREPGRTEAGGMWSLSVRSPSSLFFRERNFPSFFGASSFRAALAWYPTHATIYRHPRIYPQGTHTSGSAPHPPTFDLHLRIHAQRAAHEATHCIGSFPHSFLSDHWYTWRSIDVVILPAVMEEDSPPVARVGRHKQLYADGGHFRLVAGCVPYRLGQSIVSRQGTAPCSAVGRLQVLMISSPDRHDLVFPKGGWENDETEEEAACREAVEEAGVRGVLRGRLGVWEFRSKSRQVNEGACRGSMFALEVTEQLPSWPEKASHQRAWLPVQEAWERCRYDWMRDALAKCLQLVSGEVAPPCSAASAEASSVTLCHLNTSDNARLDGGPIKALC